MKLKTVSEIMIMLLLVGTLTLAFKIDIARARVGDINGDGAVNFLDALLLGAAFNCGVGHERWNPDADLNGDDYINYSDAVILGANFAH